MALTPQSGQEAPAAATPTLLFTAPAGTTIGRVIVANRDPTASEFSISKRIGGTSTVADEQDLARDTPIPANDIYTSIPLTLAEGDELWIEAGDAQLSFNFDGLNIT